MGFTTAMVWFLITVFGFVALLTIGTIIAKNATAPRRPHKPHTWPFHRHA